MSTDRRKATWGEIATLEYGKALRGYQNSNGTYRVFGTNGPIGRHTEPLCHHPTVVVGRKGAYRGIHFSANPCFVIDTAFYLKPSVQIDMRWAYYQLLTVDINRLDSGSAIPSTSREDFYNIPVLLPPIQEQKAIASILSTLDDKIELNHQMNQILEQMAQAIFKSWFIDFDPVKEKAEGKKPFGMTDEVAALFPSEFEETELGMVPKGWNVESLYNLADFINGAAFNSSHFTDSAKSLPIIKIAELKQGISSQTKFTEIQMAEKFRIKNGDILFSWSGNPDTSIDIFVWAGNEAWLNQHIFRVSPKSETGRNFILLQLKSLLPVFAEIARNKQTTGLGHVTTKDLKRLTITHPPKSVLEAFELLINPIMDKSFNNTLLSRNLIQARDTLLPKLISGEIRVKQAEKIVSEVV